MSIKVAINGFGRIGRLCLRAALNNPQIDVVAINGTTPPPSLAHLLKYDSVHGKIRNDVKYSGDDLIIDGKPIKILSDRNPANLKWRDYEVDIVIESTGKFNSYDSAKIHLENGAKKVVISAPAKGDVATLVMGVNENTYDPSKHDIISNASCTTNCLAPVVKVLHEQFGIASGFLSTVHAFTSDQRSLDNSHKDLRRARGCTQSIVPTTTGAARALAKVIPDLEGKFDGVSVRVPVPDVSLSDLVINFDKDISKEKINAALKKASQNQMKGIIEFCEEPLVSVDFLSNSHSAIIDGLSTMVIGSHTAKILAWYDNEWGYACRVIDLTAYIGSSLGMQKKSFEIAG